MIRAMTVSHGSLAEARALAEIADYWANNHGDDQPIEILTKLEVGK